MMTDMKNQLLLIDSRPNWRLDKATRLRGQKGVANARAILRAVDAKRAAEAAATQAALTERPTAALPEAA